MVRWKSRGPGKGAKGEGTHAVQNAGTPWPSEDAASDASPENAGPNQPISAGMIHLGVAKEIYAVLAELGDAPEQVIAEAGLDPRLFDDADNLIPASTLGRLLLLCVERTNCPHFGLLVGSRASVQSLRLVGSLMRVSETVGDALAAMAAHLRIQNRLAVVQLETEDDVALLEYLVYGSSGPGAELIADGGLATAAMLLRELCGPEWMPLEIRLPRRAPADPDPYRRFFRAPVLFDQEEAMLVFSSSWLKQRLATSDPEARSALESRIREVDAASPSDSADELRRNLRSELMKGRTTAAQMARRLSMDRRTLNRRLGEVGTTFRAVADEMRFGMARHLLADTELSLAEISAALGFSEPAAFTRAFERWSGVAPSVWRVAFHNDGSPRISEC